ncbi:hypothetical protein JTB14_000099 [Gonioctena quinquepunctata]|nr:hypothetical protein JTB14_000099 [Gonioctena quinquepunctata]
MTELMIDIIKQLLKEQTGELKNEMKESLKEVKAQLEENKKLESRSLYFERKTRKNNIVVSGFNLENENLPNETITRLNNLLDLNITINDIDKTFNHQARIKGTEIEIDGKWYTAKELQEGELNSEKEGKEESSDGSGEESVENEEIEEQNKSRQN